jgi:hypothetical protein
LLSWQPVDGFFSEKEIYMSQFASVVIEEILEHARKISAGELEQVRPGMPLRFSEACTVNDRIWQGDLALTIIASMPTGYVEAKDPRVQLVPGNTVGAKHCLDSLQGVKMFLPKDWNEESLIGPYLEISEERTILHPVHGSVTIPAGFCVHCTYQREFDRELERERRARD